MTLEAHEQTWLDAFRNGSVGVSSGPEELLAWVQLGFGLLLDAGRIVRSVRIDPLREFVQIKDDGSPFVPLETKIEELLRERLKGFAPETQVVGEETGGSLPDTGYAVAIDPLDGTWSLVNRTATLAISLAVFRDRKPIVGLVLNPATGEIAYATHGGPARILQLSLCGEPDKAATLPVERARPDSILVNVHPGRTSGPLVTALYEAWTNQSIHMVRSPGGAPTLGLLEAAQGSFVYLNLWAKQPAMAFDLAAGALLVQGAGGEITDLDGAPIDVIQHAGPFVAAVDPRARSLVTAIALKVVRQTP